MHSHRTAEGRGDASRSSVGRHRPRNGVRGCAVGNAVPCGRRILAHRGGVRRESPSQGGAAMTGRLHNSDHLRGGSAPRAASSFSYCSLASSRDARTGGVHPAPARSANPSTTPTTRRTGDLPPQKSVGDIVETDQDITVPLGTSANSVVAFGGSITIAGSVREVVAGIGADVKLLPTARVGTAAGSGDTSLVVVGGDLTSAPGATVVGQDDRPNRCRRCATPSRPASGDRSRRRSPGCH